MMDIKELMLYGPKEKQLRAKGYNTVESLLWNFPRRYEDYTFLTKLFRYDNDMSFSGAFRIIAQKIEQSKWEVKPSWVKCTGLSDETGVPVSVFWMGQQLTFNQEFLNFQPGKPYLVCGKAKFVKEYNSYTISNPAIFTLFSQDKFCLLPVYKAIPGMAAAYYKDTVMPRVLALPAFCEEPYPVDLAQKYGWSSLDAALREMHCPKNKDSLRNAQERLVFDSLLRFSAQLQYAQSRFSAGSQFNLRSTALVNKIVKALPYALTKDQDTVLRDAFDKMRNGRRLNALIQGDVGSGKTIVASLLMAAMVDSGYQCVLMAPSKVLAQQHFTDLNAMFSPLGVNVSLCLSGIKAAEKKQIANGTAQIVVGTHALLSGSLQFHNLALVVVDEEHKFGVAQRQAIVEKASAGVHSVTMSATPIPRTLAQVIYGDNIQLYTIKTMPKGRTPVATYVRPSNQLEMHVLPAVKNQLDAGHQAFVVCPAVDSSEKFEGVSVTEVSNTYRAFLEPFGYKVVTLTGKDKKADIEQKIQGFANGIYHVLVATTVIEVGVNIPNATVIVIQDAEYFGLSSLHQLRGRVGRSSFRSYCVLVSKDVKNPRLQTIKNTSNGFEIAKADLEMRGPGELLGKVQKGQSEPVELMLAYPELYQKAKAEAGEALKAGHLDWPIIKAAVAAAKEEENNG